jgi:hypothetical protein
MIVCLHCSNRPILKGLCYSCYNNVAGAVRIGILRSWKQAQDEGWCKRPAKRGRKPKTGGRAGVAAKG